MILREGGGGEGASSPPPPSLNITSFLVSFSFFADEMKLHLNKIDEVECNEKEIFGTVPVHKRRTQIVANYLEARAF